MSQPLEKEAKLHFTLQQLGKFTTAVITAMFTNIGHRAREQYATEVLTIQADPSEKTCQREGKMPPGNANTNTMVNSLSDPRAGITQVMTSEVELARQIPFFFLHNKHCCTKYKGHFPFLDHKYQDPANTLTEGWAERTLLKH
ncbi:hypothetical protein BaRGS_00009833 [Batillaria attramentaria]|uniref:Uncharacterized protein n=1 Tax=Batillaria attramentaria TaxID=370345 RepID=A0ABD0LHR0_9CAEN